MLNRINAATRTVRRQTLNPFARLVASGQHIICSDITRCHGIVRSLLSLICIIRTFFERRRHIIAWFMFVSCYYYDVLLTSSWFSCEWKSRFLVCLGSALYSARNTYKNSFLILLYSIFHCMFYIFICARHFLHIWHYEFVALKQQGALMENMSLI